MGLEQQHRSDARSVVLNLLAQSIWVIITAVAAVVTTYLLSTADLGVLWHRKLQIPAWLALLLSVTGIALGLYMFYATRRASAVRGREHATDVNVRLLASRRRVKLDERLVQSTRFGYWPKGEKLQTRADFRQELDQAIIKEGADVRRIWNINSADDVARLREVLEKYHGHDNHSIRAYFGLPYFSMPELLIVERRGASMSFPSLRQPRGLGWVIRFKRPDLVQVVRDYFEVLWDRADKILDAGQVVPAGEARLREFEALNSTNDHRVT